MRFSITRTIRNLGLGIGLAAFLGPVWAAPAEASPSQPTATVLRCLDGSSLPDPSAWECRAAADFGCWCASTAVQGVTPRVDVAKASRPRLKVAALHLK